MDVTIVRAVDLVYAILLAFIVIWRLFKKGYRVYRYANFAYLASFLYTIFAYVWTFITGHPLSIIVSTLGATVQLSAMLIAIYTQVEWHK